MKKTGDKKSRDTVPVRNGDIRTGLRTWLSVTNCNPQSQSTFCDFTPSQIVQVLIVEIFYTLNK